jgi:glycosyltransferase involved in cell wall biosynthesis
VAVSSGLLQEIEERWGGVKLRGTIEMLPYWIVGPRPGPRPRYYRGGHLRIVSACHITWEKGVHLIIEAAARLRDAGFDFSIDLYGRYHGLQFPGLILKHGLSDRVTLMGQRTPEELASLHDHYDVFAFPTLEREPFGIAPLEAASRGCVPIITRRCGVAEWLVDQVHCLKIERSVEALTSTLTDILDGWVDLEPLGRRARKVVWRDFHLDALMPRFERLFEQAASRPRTGAGRSSEAYHLASLAEKLARVMIHESVCA